MLCGKYFLPTEFFNDLFMKKFEFDFMILSRISKGVYLSLFEHANTSKHVHEHSCSSVKEFLSISAHLAHLAHLAHSVFLIKNAINE